MSALLANALVFSIVCVNLTRCSHFRGATLSWKSVNASSITDKRVIISLRIAWRKSYDPNTYCDQSTINSGHLIGPSGSSLQCRSGCSGYVGSMNFKCTDFSLNEDWSAGGRNYTYRFPDIDPPLYQASFIGGNWIYLNKGGGSWEMRMYVNLTKRRDTGRINTSPTATMSPIVRLQYGCNHTIVIPVNDVDKDDIRCRWAESSKSECAGVCRTFPGAVLDERKCQMEYLATGRTGWYAVAIMVEDFTDRLSSNALSGIPIQFLVQVFTSSEICSSKPEFSGKTRVDGSCIVVPHGSTLNERIIAKSQGTGNRIIEIKTISPFGLTKSSLAQYSANEWYVNVTWTPSQSQVDPVIFCYTAIDANGLPSDQSCVTLLAGDEPRAPYMVNGSHFPTGLIYPYNQRWNVKFDKEFVRPKRSRYIRIYRSDGTEVYAVDVSISHDVIYPAGSLGRTLEFRPSLRLIENNTYYVLLDRGIVHGTTYCGRESPPMRDPYFWRFTINKPIPLEPPILEASSSGGIEDTPIPVFLSARMSGINRTDGVTLSIIVYGVPDSFVFSRGMRSKDQVTLLKQKFGDLFVTPAEDFSGNFTVDIVAQAARGLEQTQTNHSFTINVKAKADVPVLITGDACANLTGLIPLNIKAWLNDNDGSEKLTIALSGLPNDYQLSRQGRLVNGTYYLETDSLTGLFARYDGVFEPFVLKVVATSVEKSNGNRASVMIIINVTSCILRFTCEKNCSDHGVCVAPDQCRCEEGYTGPDCSEATCEKNCSYHGVCVAPDQCRCEEGYTGPDCSQDSAVNTNPGDTKNLAAIVGGCVGGVIFLLLIAALVAMALQIRKRAAVHSENITENDHNKLVENATVDNAEIQRGVYNNPTFAYGS